MYHLASLSPFYKAVSVVAETGLGPRSRNFDAGVPMPDNQVMKLRDLLPRHWL